MLNVLQSLRGNFFEEVFIGFAGRLPFCGADKTGAFAAGGIAVQREITHHECGIAKFHRTAIQFALLVIKNAQSRTFCGQFGDNGRVVTIPHP